MRWTLVLVIGLATSASTLAAEISVEVGVGPKVEWLTVAHDASALSPLLGSPTSILAYDPIASLATNLSATVEFDDVSWLSLKLSALPVGGGHFTDTDFAAGNVVSSQTFSSAGVNRDLSATGRVALSNGLDHSLYAVGSFATRSFSANGLACGAACTTAPVPASIPVIRLDLMSGEIGLGTAGEFLVSPAGHAISRAELTFGYAALEDSHFRRVDLGPVPNITSQFLTASVRGELGYSVRISAQLHLGISASAALTGGIGQTVFGPASNAPTAPVPAFLADAAVGARLSVLGRL